MLAGCLSLWGRFLLKYVCRVALLSLWGRCLLKYVYGIVLLSLWRRLLLKYVYRVALLSLRVELVGWAVLKTGRTMVLAPPPFPPLKKKKEPLYSEGLKTSWESGGSYGSS